MAKMCEAASGSIARVGLPSRVKPPLMVPSDCEMNGLRRPLWPS